MAEDARAPPWLQIRWTDEEARNQLKDSPGGAFVVHRGGEDASEDFTLTFSTGNGRIDSRRIRVDESTGFYHLDGSDHCSHDMWDLINHFSTGRRPELPVSGWDPSMLACRDSAVCTAPHGNRSFRSAR